MKQNSPFNILRDKGKHCICEAINRMKWEHSEDKDQAVLKGSWICIENAVKDLEDDGSSERRMKDREVEKVKESFGPRKENKSLKGPLLNHLTAEKTKHDFSSTLMLQASCIYLGLISPCPETYHPLHPPRRLITPCPTTNVISTKEYSKYPT